MASLGRRLAGHLHTVHHLLRNLWRPPAPPPSERWVGELQDPVSGRVEVSGRLARVGGDSMLVVLLHGLGGSAESPYLCHAARVAAEMGVDSLRLNLRGADPAARDFYHGGLTAELHAVLADPALGGYRQVGVLGYSMGGHVALRFAAEVVASRPVAVAAVCAPLHLRTVSSEFDRPSRAFYRRWVLRHLRRCFAELEAAGARLPHALDEVRRARSFRDWDALTVVPRYRFSDPDDYYTRASAAEVLDRLRVPCLLVASEIDPVVPACAIEPYLPAGTEIDRLAEDPSGPLTAAEGAQGAAGLRLLWHPSAGHVAFPRRLALERRALGWLATVARAPAEVADRPRRRRRLEPAADGGTDDGRVGGRPTTDLASEAAERSAS